ncbi:MAG: hypothetical protein RSA53_09620 [Odoribacter sp.]
MKHFDELGIVPDDNRKMFNCPQISISDIINCEIEVLDYIADVKTQHGDNRYLVHFRKSGAEGKFFSNSKAVKDILDKIPESEFPFLTTICTVKCGSGKIYKFT